MHSHKLLEVAELLVEDVRAVLVEELTELDPTEVEEPVFEVAEVTELVDVPQNCQRRKTRNLSYEVLGAVPAIGDDDDDDDDDDNDDDDDDIYNDDDDDDDDDENDDTNNSNNDET